MGESNGTASNSSASGDEQNKRPFSRLPTLVRPIHYVVRLKPDLKKLTFTGSLEVNLEVSEATNILTCNSSDLEVTDVKVNGELVTSVKLDQDLERMVAKLVKPLEAGVKATMTCNFVGELNNNMRGFYRSKYIDQGKERYSKI